MDIKAKWLQLSEVFDNKPIRERLLVLMSLLAVIYLVWDYLFAQPINREQQALEQRFAAAKSELTKLSAEEQIFVKALNNDPGAVKQRELLSLKKQLASLDKELQSLSVGLLPAHLLPKVLHDVLDKTDALKLQSLSKGQARELLFENAAAVDLQVTLENVDTPEPVDTPSKISGVFKHAVVLKLEGSFFQVRDFLHRLESLQWKFYWESLDYNVLSYPNALVTLEIYTLSTEKGFLGG